MPAESEDSMWWPGDLKTWTEVILNAIDAVLMLITTIAVLIAALWAYTKFVIEKGSFPGVQFDIELATLGMQHDRKLIEFLLHLKNVGSSTLIVKNLRFDLLYLNENEHVRLFDSGVGRQGKLYFPGSLRRDIAQQSTSPDIDKGFFKENLSTERSEHTKGKETRGVPLLEHNTFVLPTVDQIYTFTTAIPQSVAYVLVWSSFEYEIKLTRLNTQILRISRRIGLIQYSLTHINEPHTCERVFKVF